VAIVILGLGTDVVDVSRVVRLLHCYGERIIKRLLGPEERQLLVHRYGDNSSYKQIAGFIAKRIAAKEAYVKALGKGFRHGISWREIQILNDEYGKPYLQLSGKAEYYAEQLGHDVTWWVSLADESTYASATIIVEGISNR
jgi:holo-[acyl-carrier protein] synthase